MTTISLARARELFDIYSPNPASRIVVLTTMVLGIALLAWSPASGSAVGALPFALLVWANHRRFLATLDGVLERFGALLIIVPLAVFVGRMLVSPPAASDDLLRHIASAFWPGGYADMYVHSALPPVELYPLFDDLVGGLARVIGPAPAMWSVQALAFGSFVLVFVAAARRLLGGHPAWAVFTLVALATVLQVMVGRLALARPEILMTTWSLAALLVRGPWGSVVWVAVGSLLGFGYWLAPLYFPAVLLLGLPWRARLLVLAVLGGIWAAYWVWATGGEVVSAVAWTLERVRDRIPGLTVAENTSILSVLYAPQMMVLAMGALWALRQPGADKRLLWLAAFYLLSNQARYGGILAPLFALAILSGLRNREWRPPVPLRSALALVCAGWFSLMSHDVPRYSEMPRFALPEGSVVMTGFSQATYSTLFANPGRVRVAPAFEIGAADPRVQRLVLDLARGGLDCAALAPLGFTHLIEDRLAGPARDCLELHATQAKWRLWRVVPGAGETGR